MIHRLAMLAIAGGVALAPRAWAISPDRTLAQLQHTAWTAREGVPLGIRALAQTDDGYLWLGTASGLYRFDGVRFTRQVGVSGDALPQDTVTALAAMPGNGLMVGWLMSGVSVVRQGHVAHTRPGKDFPAGTVYFLARGNDGSAWAAVRDGAAHYADGRWERAEANWGITGKRPRSVFVDRDGTVCIPTDDGLELLQPGERQFHLSPGPLLGDGWDIGRAPDGTLYVADPKGIRPVESLALRGQARRPWVWKNSPSAVNFWPGFLIDRGGGMWITTFDTTIERLRFPSRSPGTARELAPERFEQRDGLSFGYGTAFLEDREGSVWLATTEGLNRFRETRLVKALPGSYHSLLALDDGTVLAGGTDGGAVRIDKPGIATPYPLAGEFTAAVKTVTGDLLLGFYRGTNSRWHLARVSHGRVTEVPAPPDAPPGSIHVMAQDSQGGIWASFVGFGIHRLADGRWTQPVPGEPALYMHATADGSVWLGYVGNRLRRWRSDGTQEFAGPQGLRVGNVRALQSDGERLWIGGDEGLCLHEGGRIRCLETRERDVLRGIRGIVVTPQGDVWMSTSQGAVWLAADDVRRALAATDGFVTYRQFDTEDGLQGLAAPLGPVPTIALGKDGRVWLSTSRGVFVADPAQIPANQHPPPVVIEALQAGTSHIEWPKEQSLPPRFGQLRIQYTALSLSMPLRTRFRYRLDGVDADWQEAGERREATYTQLGPGRYRFRVMAASEDGIWGDAGAQLDFTVEPAFVETVWFKALCVLAAALLLALAYRVRVRYIRRQFQARFQERLVERERIARELHDTLLQSVQGLILRCQAAMMRLAGTDPARDMLEAALMQADEVLNEGRDRINDLRLADTGQASFEDGLRQAGAELAQGIEFQVVAQGPCRRLHPLVAEEALRIAREAISNAARHAGTPRIEVDVIYAADGLRLHVRDAGKGIDADILAAGGVAGHWGLSGMQERARVIGAKLHVWSRNEAGTEVELRVPATAAYVSNARPETEMP